MRSLWLLLLTPACIGPPDPGDTGGPSPTVIWAGWNHTWEMLSHRVSNIRAVLQPDGTLSMGIQGGDWSTGESFTDDVGFRMHVQRIQDGAIQVEHGQSAFTIGPDGLAQVQAQTTDLDPDLVVLRGFEIDTDVAQSADYPENYDPAHGYTSRGFGFGLRPVEDEWGPSFVVEAAVRWGPQDRPAMNEAIPHAQTRVTVYWTAISGVGSVQTASIGGGFDLAHEPPNSAQGAFTAPLALESGPGIVGIQRFDLGISAQDGSEEGDYLRSFGAEVLPTPTGTPPAAATLEATTTSLFEVGTMRFDGEMDLVWLPLESSGTAVTGATKSGSHPVGRTEFPPTD